MQQLQLLTGNQKPFQNTKEKYKYVNDNLVEHSR